MNPEDRIRMLMEENAMLRAQLQGPIDIGELDMSDAGPAPLDVPTLDQINTPVYPTNANAFGYGGMPEYSFAPPAQPSKRDRVAAAHQMRRQQGRMPYGG